MKQMYPSLTEMAAELERQNAAKQDYLVPKSRIHFVSQGADASDGRGALSEIDLTGTDAEGLVLNDVCHGQFAERLGIPKHYYDKMRASQPGLLDRNVMTWLQSGEDDRWMIRTLPGVARASLSDSYLRIDNFPIAEAVLHVLSQAEGQILYRSGAITDKRMYLKVVTPRLEGEVKVGQTVRAGLYIANSEVGHGAVVIKRFVETLQCTNGMVIEREAEGALRKIHLSRRLEADGAYRILSDEARIADDRAFMLALRDVVKAALDETLFTALVAQMAEAAQSTRVQDVQGAVEALGKAEGLSEGEQKGILQHLAEGGDLSRWGLLSAVTRTAEDLDSYDRATELESLGGKILDYSEADWRKVATATA
jgi:hypothetical protein